MNNFMTREQLNQYIKEWSRPRIRLYSKQTGEMKGDFFLYRIGDEQTGRFFVNIWWQCPRESHHTLQTGDTIGIEVPGRTGVVVKKLLL